MSERIDMGSEPPRISNADTDDSDAEGSSSNHLSPNRILHPVGEIPVKCNVSGGGYTDEAKCREYNRMVNGYKEVSNSSSTTSISLTPSDSYLRYLNGVDEDTALMLRFLLRNISQKILADGPPCGCELLVGKARNLIILLENAFNRRISTTTANNAEVKLCGSSQISLFSLDDANRHSVIDTEEESQEESDEAAWKEKEKEEEKSIRGSEGNSTVVSVDEVIGEADNDGTTSTKESTTIPIHPVLDMIINHLPHELGLQMATRVGDFMAHPIHDVYVEEEESQQEAVVNINEVSNSLDELQVREFLSGCALDASISSPVVTNMANMSFNNPVGFNRTSSSNSWPTAVSASNESLSSLDNIKAMAFKHQPQSSQSLCSTSPLSHLSLSTPRTDLDRGMHGLENQSTEPTKSWQAKNLLRSERRDDFLKFRLVLEKGTGVHILKCNDNGGRRKCCLQYSAKDNSIRWRSSRRLLPGEKIRCDKIVRTQRDEKVLHVWHMVSSTHGFIRKMVAFEAKSTSNARIIHNAFLYMQDNLNAWKETTLSEK